MLKCGSYPKSYLGDGVYAQFDGFHIWIYTSDGIKESEKIALEQKVLDQLVKFNNECRKLNLKPIQEKNPISHHQV